MYSCGKNYRLPGSKTKSNNLTPPFIQNSGISGNKVTSVGLIERGRGHSGGPVPDFNGVPYYALQAPEKNIYSPSMLTWLIIEYHPCCQAKRMRVDPSFLLTLHDAPL